MWGRTLFSTGILDSSSWTSSNGYFGRDIHVNNQFFSLRKRTFWLSRCLTEKENLHVNNNFFSLRTINSSHWERELLGFLVVSLRKRIFTWTIISSHRERELLVSLVVSLRKRIFTWTIISSHWGREVLISLVLTENENFLAEPTILRNIFTWTIISSRSHREREFSRWADRNVLVRFIADDWFDLKLQRCKLASLCRVPWDWVAWLNNFLTSL